MEVVQEVGEVVAAAENSFRAHYCIHHFLVRWALATVEVGGGEEEAEVEAFQSLWRTISSPK